MTIVDNNLNPIKEKNAKDRIRRTLTPRLLSWWDWAEQTNPGLVSAGLGWYTAARSFVYTLSRQHLLSYRRVAGAVAIMSQQTRWTTQIRYTSRWLHAVVNGQDASGVNATLYRGVADKAYQFIHSGDESLITGDKIRNFYDNLLGRNDNVTVDSWAIRAALTRPGTDPDKIYKSITESDLSAHFRGGSLQRRSLEAAYKLAAADKAVTPAQFQAVVWVAVRTFHKA